MKELLHHIKVDSLKEVFVTCFEELILSGKLSSGQKVDEDLGSKVRCYF